MVIRLIFHILEFGHNRGFNAIKPFQIHVKAISGHAAFDPQNILRFGQI